MQLTAKRGKKPAKMKLFEVDKRRMGEICEIFNVGAMVLEGEQATLCKAASEAIAKAQAALEAALAKVQLPLDDAPTTPAELAGESDDEPIAQSESAEAPEETPAEAAPSNRRRK